MLDITGVLRAAIELPSRNRKTMVSVTLLGLIPFSAPGMFHAFLVRPLLQELEDYNDTHSTEASSWGCYGMKALGKSRELIGGRKIQGFVFMLFLELLIDDDEDLEAITQMAFGSVLTFLFFFVKAFCLRSVHIFYYKRQEEP
ncbi:hypothetical protein NE237_028047 [Protea cynaroides]|uniref:Uncharacterized protein n=1 Tax=Protea cynaroides TaxID=273540 RepID=A0A9Q0JUS3_9MAGN|nr:hypothetical protein NE237_028047 [Protea cynaroides]